MKTYLFSYHYDGAKYGFEIVADSEDEAKERLARIPYAHYDGILEFSIPVVPKWTVRVWNAVRRAFA